MADHEQPPAQRSPQAAGREVVRYFFREQARDPEYMHRLARKLWNALSGVDQDTITAAHTPFFPDDLEGRQNSIYASLIEEYIKHERRTVQTLNRLYRED